MFAIHPRRRLYSPTVTSFSRNILDCLRSQCPRSYVATIVQLAYKVLMCRLRLYLSRDAHHTRRTFHDWPAMHYIKVNPSVFVAFPTKRLSRETTTYPWISSKNLFNKPTKFGRCARRNFDWHKLMSSSEFLLIFRHTGWAKREECSVVTTVFIVLIFSLINIR